MIYYDIKIGDKVVYNSIPEHSLSLQMKKAQEVYGKRPVAQSKMFGSKSNNFI